MIEIEKEPSRLEPLSYQRKSKLVTTRLITRLIQRVKMQAEFKIWKTYVNKRIEPQNLMKALVANHKTNSLFCLKGQKRQELFKIWKKGFHD